MKFFIKQNNESLKENIPNDYPVSAPTLISKSKQFKNIVPKQLEKDTKFPDITQLLNRIKEKYLNTKYLFNLPNNPSTTRYPANQPSQQDHEYLKYIKKDIKTWNNILNTPINIITIKNIHPILVVETSDELLIKVTAELKYLKTIFYLELSYYGLIERTDDFFTNQNNTIHLQLVEINKININQYLQSKQPVTEEAPFITMSEQMAYVDEINKKYEATA